MDRRCCCISIFVLLLVIALAVGIYLLIHFLGSEPTEVDTLNGRIQGRIVYSPQGDKVREFLGIPFAKPPVGDLRYHDPVPIENFTKVPYEANDYQNSCIQTLDTTFGNFTGATMWNPNNPLSEDCLYLNIWAPNDDGKRKTVMVWIYGGGFYSGSNQLWIYDGKALAAHGDVIVASFNYRVGSFGFLSTGDDRIKGNYGLKDQQLALRWIKDNIASFGGDPGSITLFGESAGAASVGYHLLLPGSEDLFHRAILQSGSPDAHYSYKSPRKAHNTAAFLFRGLGCPDDNRILQCVRSRTAKEILENEWINVNYIEYPWKPVVDKDFIADTPHNLLMQGQFHKKDVLLGSNKDEGTSFMLGTIPGLSKDGPSPVSYPMFLQGVNIIAWDLTDDQKARIRNIYLPRNTRDSVSNRDALDDISGDRSFKCPTVKLADILSPETNTYYYYLTYRASNEVWPEWMGVIHGADIQWIFGTPLKSSRNYTSGEVKFSKTVMDYWVNFAKTGNPSSGGLPHWPQYNPSGKKHMELAGPRNFRTGANLTLFSHCQFWNEVHEYWIQKQFA